MVAIVHELLENSEQMLELLESLEEEVGRARSAAEAARNVASGVDKTLATAVPLTRLLPPPHNRTARVATAFVCILAGLVDVGSHAFEEFRSDQLLIRFRDYVEEDERRLEELSRFWGVELGCEGGAGRAVAPPTPGGLRGVIQSTTVRLKRLVLKVGKKKALEIQSCIQI